jgi:cytosine deaminase
MKIINARLRHKESLYTLDLDDGVIKASPAGRRADG